MAMNHELPIDTSYLPVDRFKYKIMDKQLTDSVSVFYFIQYLKALEEPPIYCCESDSILRVLAIHSYEPATVIKLYNQNDSLLVEHKTANKIEFDNSHYDISHLDQKEQRKWFKVYRAGPPATKEDSIILSKGYIRDTTEYEYRSNILNISQSNWDSIFDNIKGDFYNMVTVPDDDGSLVIHGTQILIEAYTDLGYKVLSRKLNHNEEQQLSTLLWKINQLTEN